MNDMPTELLELIVGKGWNVYGRGPIDNKLSTEETYQEGPVQSVERDLLYIILPQVEDPTSKEQVDAFIERHQISPRLQVPRDGFDYFGRQVYQWSGGDDTEDSVFPSQRIDFIGFVMLVDDVQVLAPTQTFMPYKVFLASLENLQDINGLE